MAAQHFQTAKHVPRRFFTQRVATNICYYPARYESSGLHAQKLSNYGSRIRSLRRRIDPACNRPSSALRTLDASFKKKDCQSCSALPHYSGKKDAAFLFF